MPQAYPPRRGSIYASLWSRNNLILNWAKLCCEIMPNVRRDWEAAGNQIEKSPCVFRKSAKIDWSDKNRKSMKNCQLTNLRDPEYLPNASPDCCGEKPMILVVDDHQDTLHIITRILAIEGYETHGVTLSGDALEFLRGNAVALVILDFNLPDMDGFEVFRAMRADPRLRTIPAIMFSASDGSIEAQAMAMGISAYVMKGSLDWANLFQEIVRLIGKGTPRVKREDKGPRTKDAG
jgi:PleD family two-component response regulator